MNRKKNKLTIAYDLNVNKHKRKQLSKITSLKVYLVSSKYSSISALGQSSSGIQGPLVFNLINPGLQKQAYPQ